MIFILERRRRRRRLLRRVSGRRGE